PTHAGSRATGRNRTAPKDPSVPLSKSSWSSCLPRWQIAARRSVRSIAEQVISLHDLVNLAGALVDDGPLAVAIEPPDGILVRVAVGAMNLHRVTGGPFRSDC